MRFKENGDYPLKKPKRPSPKRGSGITAKNSFACIEKTVKSAWQGMVTR